ncbi:lantibiotic dehydratase family protein [Aureibacter tunicatorum]|uniref:Lantibiotic dehydratase N-terminal domain-containing protein n=1 Tax=Aureibacter tunicatorum TaxID=866807 RepID=A0AAE4BTE7_9BACT|nr:lantibiotic dehydratase family protein [Aureibacter tunicatorum]MDR6239502.1 hypothetical protein [Aureibacter tunicatorum]BDD04578.1 hypothetical protein AUTU_20610 [Aureibacter tunicatorum]
MNYINQIIPFSKFIYRVPQFSLSSLSDNYNDLGNYINGFLLNKEFLESLYIASSDLYNELENYDHSNEKINLSFLKYLLRSHVRCTPFGLFAGVGIGDISNKEKSEIILNKTCKYKSHTRVDMGFLSKILDANILSDKDLKTKSQYYPSTSAYTVMNEMRYTEYKYKSDYRKYFLTSVERDEALEHVLNISKKGVKYVDLVSSLVNEYIDEKDARDYIDELIQSQILISELSPSVNGDDLLHQIIIKCQRLLSPKHELVLSLCRVRDRLRMIDSKPIGREISDYEYIKGLLNELNSDDIVNKSIFQSDLYVTSNKAELSISLLDDLKKGIDVLNRLTPYKKDENIANFIEEFYKRYEDEEVPLVQVLDVDTGLGFPVSQDNDISPLVNGIHKSTKNENVTSVSTFDKLLMKKLSNIRNNEIVIDEDDLKEFDSNWERFPDTIYSMIEVVYDENRPLIIMSGCGANSSKLLGRFCYGNEEIHQFVQQMVDKETSMSYNNEVLAEIAHLPQERIGNILQKPSIRKFEIPYLSHSECDEDNTIPITDLYISIRNRDQIVLRSKTLNKEIKTRLTTAHNYYSSASLPIYYFLCALQEYDKKNSLYVSYGEVFSDKIFFPRVRYENIILYSAKWILKRDFFDNILSHKSFLKQKEELLKLLNKFFVPGRVTIGSNDNKILIDFDNDYSIKLFLKEAIKGRQIILTEFLHSEDHSLIINENGEAFTNELILGFYNNTKNGNEK